MSESIMYVGIDVHAENSVIAVYKNNEMKPMAVVVKKSDKTVMKAYFKKLLEQGKVVCCYEAGFSGFTMYRYLEDMGVTCVVAAPSKLPRAKGNHTKTDRRDAELLARTLRNGDIVSVYVPNKEDENTREYIRLRADHKKIAKEKKQQLLAFLKRHGLKWYKKVNWTQEMRKWLMKLDMGKELNEVLREYYITLLETEEKIARMDAKIEEKARDTRYAERVGKLCCLRGVGTLTTLSFITEVGDFRRFKNAGAFMSYLGLTPREHSSGKKRIQGSITKAGNSYLRRLLVESSWHDAKIYNPKPSKRLERRRQG